MIKVGNDKLTIHRLTKARREEMSDGYMTKMVVVAVAPNQTRYIKIPKFINTPTHPFPH